MPGWHVTRALCLVLSEDEERSDKRDKKRGCPRNVQPSGRRGGLTCLRASPCSVIVTLRSVLSSTKRAHVSRIARPSCVDGIPHRLSRPPESSGLQPLNSGDHGMGLYSGGLCGRRLAANLICRVCGERLNSWNPTLFVQETPALSPEGIASYYNPRSTTAIEPRDLIGPPRCLQRSLRASAAFQPTNFLPCGARRQNLTWVAVYRSALYAGKGHTLQIGSQISRGRLEPPHFVYSTIVGNNGTTSVP